MKCLFISIILKRVHCFYSAFVKSLFQNFYLIDPNLVMFLTALMSRRMLWCFYKEVSLKIYMIHNSKCGSSVYLQLLGTWQTLHLNLTIGAALKE